VYFLTSSMLAPIGVISGSLAQRFDEPITQVTARFGWLTFGMLIGAIGALFVYQRASLRQVLLPVYATILISLLTLAWLNSLASIGIALGLIGVGCGIAIPGAAQIISSFYVSDRRASKLVATDAAFSFAGIFVTWLATYLLTSGYPWSAVYQWVAVSAAMILALSLKASFPSESINPTTQTRAQRSASRIWPIEVWFCIVALFLYTLGQWSVLWWLPNYVEMHLTVSPQRAGQLVSQYWTGLFAAQLFVAWWVLRVGLNRVLVIACVSTTLCSIPLWSYAGIDGLLVLATLWGFANLGVLKLILSFATELLATPSTRLLSALMLGATLGTAVSPGLTSAIVDHWSSYRVLQFGTACHGIMAALVLFAAYRHSANATPATNS